MPVVSVPFVSKRLASIFVAWFAMLSYIIVAWFAMLSYIRIDGHALN